MRANATGESAPATEEVCVLSMPLLLSLWVPSAGAFAPTVLPTGIEPSRIQYDHPQVQAGLLNSDAWQRFAATDGVGWTARFDEATGTPRWLWGRGIPVPTGSADAVAGTVQRILERHADLLGLEGGELVLTHANYNAAFDTWYVGWDLRRDGLSTYRKELSARVKHGKLEMLTAATSPGADLRGDFTLSADRAIDLAIGKGPVPGAVHTDRTVERILLERLDTTGLHLQRTFMVTTRTDEPPGKWVTFVDGQTGALLNVHNEVRFVSGSVTGFHRERTVDGSPLVASGIPLVNVEGDVDAAVTDADGLYDVTASDLYTTGFDGDYLTVSNDAGADAILSSDDPDLVWDEGSTTLAEIDTYLAAHRVRDWAFGIDATVGMVTDPLLAIVNLNMDCNAFYDGNLNFFHTGGQCNNTGEIFDVVFHEWGHGFHATSIETGFLDGSLGEAVGDTVAFLQTNDNEIGPYFFTNGGPVRDVDPDKVYPDDYINFALFVHENGLIFGGAMWDLLGLMQAKYGVQAGTDTTSRLLAGLVKGGPDIVGSYYEILVADDDDGDLQNGTPNQCDIMDAFGRHGLIGFTLAATHEPLTTTAADEPALVEVDVVSTTALCAASTPESAVVHYRVDRADWLEVPATVSGNHISGEIPAQPLGHFVEYYIDGLDSLGVGFSAPAGGRVAPYSYFSGDVLEVNCEDFEADDGGFTHSLLDGVDEPGADDWEWGTPTGLAGDPTFAFSGTKVWGNDLGTDGAYLPGKTNYLVGPAIPTRHFSDVFLQYRRWLQVEDAGFDRGMILANDELVWTNFNGQGSDHHIDQQWVSHSVYLGGRGDRGELRVGFGIASDPGLEMAGWTIDDVCIYAPATADNRLGVDDFVAADLGGPIGLSWTNPQYGPVSELVVVKRTDRYPTSHEDGDVVATIPSPALGEAASAEDPNVDGEAGYYAVYATDGTAWSSFTIEGLNADFAAKNAGGPDTEEPGDTDDDPAAESPDGDDEDTKGGCGCSTGPGTVGWLVLPLVVLIGRRRKV